MPCLGSGLIYLQVYLLIFEAAPEPFDEDVVTLPPTPVHADRDLVDTQHIDEVFTGKFAALVGVEDLRPALAQGVTQVGYLQDCKYRADPEAQKGDLILDAPSLWQFTSSHYNEKVRWALDDKRVPHFRHSLVPGFHFPVIRKMTGATHPPGAQAERRNNQRLEQDHRGARTRLPRATPLSGRASGTAPRSRAGGLLR